MNDVIFLETNEKVEKYVLKIAQGKMDKNEIAIWLEFKSK